MEQRICRRCLLKELGEGYFQNVYEYITSLPDEIKVCGEEYERRLKICRSCENLVNGMCRICGCFVETRAVKIFSYCPDTKTKW